MKVGRTDSPALQNIHSMTFSFACCLLKSVVKAILRQTIDSSDNIALNISEISSTAMARSYCIEVTVFWCLTSFAAHDSISLYRTASFSQRIKIVTAKGFT